MNVEGFLADILAEPDALARVATRYGDARLERLLGGTRVLFIGMGTRPTRRSLCSAAAASTPTPSWPRPARPSRRQETPLRS